MGEVLLPSVFFGVLLYTLAARSGSNPGVVFLGLSVLCFIMITQTFIPMMRSWITFGRNIIEGSVNGKPFQFYYAEVLAAWLVERKRRRFLCLATKNGTVLFPLYFFNDFAIWGEIRLRLPPEALGNEAVKRLPGSQSWTSEQESPHAGEETPCTVADHWTLQIIGWCTMTFALFGMVTSLRGNNLEIGMIFGAVILLCMILLFRWGITEISPNQIRRNTMFRSYSITWVDVVRIEKDPLGINLVLVGEDCQLVIPGPAMWSRLGKQPALQMLDVQTRLRNIPTQNTILALLKFNRRSRMAH